MHFDVNISGAAFENLRLGQDHQSGYETEIGTVPSGLPNAKFEEIVFIESEKLADGRPAANHCNYTYWIDSHSFPLEFKRGNSSKNTHLLPARPFGTSLKPIVHILRCRQRNLIKVPVTSALFSSISTIIDVFWLSGVTSTAQLALPRTTETRFLSIGQPSVHNLHCLLNIQQPSAYCTRLLLLSKRKESGNGQRSNAENACSWRCVHQSGRLDCILGCPKVCQVHAEHRAEGRQRLATLLSRFTCSLQTTATSPPPQCQPQPPHSSD